MDHISVEGIILGRPSGQTQVDRMLYGSNWQDDVPLEPELYYCSRAEALADCWDGLSSNFEAELLLYAVWFLRLYAQCMWVGPEMDAMSRKALPKVLSDRATLNLLSVEGELVETHMELPGALYLARRFLTHPVATSAYALWWRARSSIMLHRSLAGGLQQCLCPDLRREALTAIVRAAQAFGLLEEDFDLEDDRHRSLAAQLDSSMPQPPEAPLDLLDEDRDLMMLEILNVMTLYGFGDAFRDYLETEDSAWKHTVALTGRLGIKRAHQVDAIPQLSVMLQSSSTEASPAHSSEEIVPRDIVLEELDAGTDLLARPKFVDEEEARVLSLSEKFYLLAWASQKMQESVATDALSMSVVVAITAEIVHDGAAKGSFSGSMEEVTSRRENADWALWGSALYLRSRAEFQRSKLKERSCLQILALEEQHSQSSPPAHRRLESLWLTSYPNKWELRREVGRKFRAMGAALTARDMFAKMHMWTEVIECLLSVGRRNEANDVLQEQLRIDSESAVLWYLSGEVSGNLEHYLESWRLSGGKFAKAARALGRYHLEKNRGEALRWFSEAVRIQPYHPATQFTYGCLLMQSGQLKAALTAFNAVICDDEDQFEAWANMGAIHSQLEQWASAKKCLQAAARKAQNRWRIWDSYAKICFKLDDILGAFEGLQRLVELDAAAQIQIWMLHRLVVQVTEQTASATKADFVSRVLQFFKKYFNALRVPLPSQRNSPDDPKTAFDLEPVRTCADRYRIWAVLTEALHLAAESHEISLKAAREVLRVIEDCLAHECPQQLRTECASYAIFVESLLKLWARSINEVHHYRAILRETATDLNQFEQTRTETTRFILTSFTRIKAQLAGCSLISVEERREILQNLEGLEAQAA